MSRVVNQTIQEDLESITKYSNKDLQHIVNSNVLLTGASGFVGKWLSLSYLHARKSLGGSGTITLSCRDASPLRILLEDANFREGFDFVECDIRQFPENAIQDGTLLIHAATPARASLNAENPLEMFDIIVSGQRRLLELCARRKEVRFLFLSSGAIYGSQPLELLGITEEWSGAPDVGNPQNAYHEGKRVAELLGNTFAARNAIEFVSARLFAFLAPFLPLDEHFAAGNFLGDAVAGRNITINSGGGSIRSYQYATDLCVCLWALLARGTSGEAYNVGSEHEITILQLAEKIATIVNGQLDVKVLGIDSEQTLNRYVPATSKIQQIVDLPKVDVAESIMRFSSWLRSLEQ